MPALMNMKVHIDIRRAYEEPGKNEGYRILVDRLWPRGISKDELKFDTWCKDLAPSPALRKWFGHKVDHWEKFRTDYLAELRSKDQQARMRELIESAGVSRFTLIYGARDTEHNHALILADEMAHVAQSISRTRKQSN